MTYNGIGIATPRGTGTNGFVQKALGALQRPSQTYEQRRDWNDQSAGNLSSSTARHIDPALLEHERKRAVEVALTDWAEAEGIYDRE
jgi:serine/arginine repetitive matrix protein 2